MNCFNANKWTKVINRPDWYFEVVPDFNKIVEIKKNDKEKYEQCIKGVYDFFEKNLKESKIFLGNAGINWDQERKPITSVIIHHTSQKPGIMRERLSAMELIRLYATYYYSDEEVKSQPIFSGHFRNGKQIFYPYHWIVRKDGKKEKLLFDEEIGWHSGNWEVNCRSVGIVLDGDFENSVPSKTELEAVAEIINKKYFSVRKENILGHREINPKTSCPSNFFLGKDGWKNELLDRLN